VIIWDAIDPVELTGYVRAALADREQNQPSLARWLPNRQIRDLEFRFNAGGQGLTDAATFRTYDAESPIGSRPSRVRRAGELPPISRKIRLGEYDRLRLANADGEIQNEIFADALRMTQQVRARLELARGEALYRGRIDLNENGVVATVDFGRSGSHTVAPATLWSSVATATPLTDELAWYNTYVATNGQPPAVALTSTAVATYLLRNAEYRALAARGGVAPGRISRAELDAIRADYGLPPIEVYDAQFRVGGVNQRVIPEDRFVYLPPPDADADTNELGGTLYGVTAEAQELDGIEQQDEAGIVAVAMKAFDPVAIWTKAAAIALPIVANPDLTLAADVA
jgi:hypothetical protein